MRDAHTPCVGGEADRHARGACFEGLARATKGIPLSDRRQVPSERRTLRHIRVLVAILVAIAVVHLLRAADAVFLPLAFAVFLIGLFWPLQRALQARLPGAAAVLITLAAFLATTGLFGWALYESAEEVAERAPSYSQAARALVGDLRAWTGLPLDGDALQRRAQDFALAQSGAVASLIGGVILVIGYFLLGLLEVLDFRVKLDQVTRDRQRRDWREPVRRIARDFQSYMVVRTAVGLITGIGTGLAAWAIGLEFPLLWGVLNFLLNYIPTLGSILGVFPPVLFALVQGGWQLALLALLGVGGVQIVMGIFVDPRMQGRYLRLSPLVVLLSVVFWEWVWGIPGAFIGVPLTVGLVIACARFDGTRWIALLLSDAPEADAPGGDAQVAEGGAAG